MGEGWRREVVGWEKKNQSGGRGMVEGCYVYFVVGRGV